MHSTFLHPQSPFKTHCQLSEPVCFYTLINGLFDFDIWDVLFILVNDSVLVFFNLQRVPTKSRNTQSAQDVKLRTSAGSPLILFVCCILAMFLTLKKGFQIAKSSCHLRNSFERSV